MDPLTYFLAYCAVLFGNYEIVRALEDLLETTHDGAAPIPES